MAQLSQRGEIRLGFRCNARCGFCYYGELLDQPKESEPGAAELIKRLEALRASGATEVEFTGGEPTIRADLPSLVRHARQLGFVNISVITNGLRLSHAAYARHLTDAGVNDFLFSIHGHTAAIHDAHTGVSGSFEKILRAMRHVQAARMRCRSSTTITGKNVHCVSEIVQFLIDVRVDTIHLAVFSPVAQARVASEMSVTYTQAANAIKKAIDRHAGVLPPLSVKYIPFCVMRGYEQYVMNLYQQSFDPDDWNYYLSNKIRRTETRLQQAVFDLIVGVGAILAKDRSFPLKYGWDGLKVFGLTRIVELLRKRRPSACRTCRYDLVCDHVWRDYLRRFGSAEFTAVPGEMITDPAWCYGLAKTRAPGAPVGPRTTACESPRVV